MYVVGEFWIYSYFTNSSFVPVTQEAIAWKWMLAEIMHVSINILLRMLIEPGQM